MWSRLGAGTLLLAGALALTAPGIAHAQDPVDLDGAYVLDTVGALSGEEGRVQDALETGSHPDATFTLTSPIVLPADAAVGGEINTTAKGDLAIHGVTKSVEFPLQAKLVNGTVVAVGSIDVTFSDFGVEVPSSQMVLSVEDHGTLELQFLLTKG